MELFFSPQLLCVTKMPHPAKKVHRVNTRRVNTLSADGASWLVKSRANDCYLVAIPDGGPIATPITRLRAQLSLFI
jgi:hypothetical protein